MYLEPFGWLCAELGTFRAALGHQDAVLPVEAGMEERFASHTSELLEALATMVWAKIFLGVLKI